MSYDLTALRVPPGRTVQDVYENDDISGGDEPPTPEQWTEMRRLADALMALDPAAERFERDDAIELDLPGMQVSVYADQAAISVPYWFEGGDAKAVMRQAHAYAEVLASVGGYVVYDHQTEEVVSGPPTGAAQHVYGATSARVARMAGEGSSAPRRRFWRRGR